MVAESSFSLIFYLLDTQLGLGSLLVWLVLGGGWGVGGLGISSILRSFFLLWIF